MFTAIKLGIAILVEFTIEKKALVPVLLGLVLLTWLIGLFGGFHGLGSSLGLSIMVGLLAGVVAFFIAPNFFNSSLKEVSYSMDWAFHIISCLGVAVYATIVVWPLVGLIS